MKEFIEKLIGRLEELYDINDKTKKEAYQDEDWEKFDLFTHRNEGVYIAISIVNQLAEEYGKDINVTTNADFIRKMSDEELAEFLLKVNTANEQPCMIDGGDCKWEDYPTRDKGCKDCFLEYLRKEVKGSE